MEIKTTKQLQPVEYWKNIILELKSNPWIKTSFGKTFDKYERLINFITQKLELWMFIPSKLVNGKWEVLEKPIDYFHRVRPNRDAFEQVEKVYKEAESKVLFKAKSKNIHTYTNNTLIGIESIGFIDQDGKFELVMGYQTIQDILHLDLELTDNAKKQL